MNHNSYIPPKLALIAVVLMLMNWAQQISSQRINKMQRKRTILFV